MNETRPVSCFRSLYRISTPGSRINEDGAGLHGCCAWIVDGATGVVSRQLAVGASDAAWLAATICEQLRYAIQSARSADEIFQELETGIQNAFAKDAGQARGENHAPSACLGFLRIEEARDGGRTLEGRFLGDVAALIPTEAGILRWTDERSKPFERRTLAAIQMGNCQADEVPEAVRRQILENRTKLNRPDGYWVVNPLRPWAGRELRFETPLATGQPVVLATDGFLRLVDVFAAYTDQALYARLAAGEGESLMKELRELERRDQEKKAYPRVKIHDDATVLVMAAECCG